MSRPLDILVNATLKMDNINNQLKELSNKGINIGVDSNGIQNVLRQVQQLQRQVETKLGGFKVIDAETAQKELDKVGNSVNDLNGDFRKLFTSVEDAKKYFQQLGQVKINTNFDPLTKQLDNFTVQITRANGEIQKLKLNMVSVDGLNTPHYEIGKISGVDNSDALLERQLQLEQRINSQIQANNESEVQHTQQLQHQISLYQQQAEISARSLTRQFGGNVDQTAIDSYLNSVRELNTDTPEVRQRMQQLGVDFRNIRENALQSASEVSSFGNALKEAFSKFPIWMLTATIFYAPFRALQSGIDTIHQLDDAMTDLKKVTNETSDTYAQFAQNVNQSANSIGASTADFINATTEFARIGLNLQQSQASAKQAMIYANVGDFGANSAAASEDLISTMKAYNMEFDDQGKNLQKIVDLYNNVSNKYSIDAQGIGDAMKRGAASLAVAGNSIEQSVALITAANDSIQDPAKVGNALKTVSMRLMGVDQQGNSIAGLVPKLEKQFNQLGLTLKDSNGNLKSTYDIMVELAGVFNSGKLNNLEKSNILNLVAGKQQGNIVAGLLANVKDLKSALKDGLNSAGSSMQELNVYLDSITARMNKFQNAAVGFWQKSLNSDEFKSFIDAGTGIINLLSNLTSHFGLLPPVVLATSLAIMGFNDNLRKATTSKGLAFLDSLKNGFREVQTSAEASVVGIEAVTAAETTLGETETAVSAISKGASILGFLSGSILPVAGIMAATFAIEKLVGAYSDWHQQQVKEQQEAQALENTYANNSDQIKQLANQYENLSARVANGTITKNNQDYIDVQNRLNQLLPQVTKSIDSQGNAHLKNVQAVNQEIASLDKLNQLNSNKFIEDFSKSLSDINKQIKDTQESISKIGTTQVVSHGAFADQFGTQTHKLTTDDQMNQILQGMKLDQQLQERADLFKKLATEYANSKGLTDQLTKSEQNYLNQLVDNNKAQLDSTDKAKKFSDQLENTVTILANLQKTVGNGIDVSKIFGDLSSKASEQEKQLLVIDDSIKKYNSGSMSANQFADALSKVGISSSKAKDILKGLTVVQQDSINATKAQTDAQTALQNMLDGTTSLEDTLSKELIGYTAKEIDQQTQLIELYNALSQITNKNAQQMALYNQVKAKLISMFPDELKGQKLSLVGMENEVNARKVMSKAAIDSADNRLSAEASVTFGLAKNLQKQEQIIKAMIKNYEALMMSAVTVDPKNGAVAMNGVAMHWYNEMKAAESQLTTVSASYISTTAKLAKQMNYSVDFNTPSFPSGGSSGSGSSKSKKGKSSGSGSSSSQPVAEYQTDKYQQQLDALDTKIKEVDASTQKLDHTSKGYIDGLKEEISLTKQKDAVVNSEISSLEKRDKAIQKQLKSMGSFNHLSNAQKQTYNQLAQELDQNTQKINQLKDANIGYANDISNLNDQIKQSYSDLADQVVQIEKDAYEKERQIALDANKKKMDDLDAEHNKIMQNYDDEMSKYQDVTDQKTKALDKASSDRSYNESLSAKQKAAQDTLNQINVMKLDTSAEGQAKLADLQKQYAQEQQDIQDTQYQHGVDLQKQNLQDQATSYQKDIDAKKKAEDDKYNATKTELQKEQDAINKYYDNIANDDRKWAKLHQDIMNGHFDQVKKDFKNFTDILKGHMDELGKSITQNLLDTLDQASKEMAALTGASTPSSSGGKKSSSGGSKSSSGSSHKSSGSSHHDSSSSSHKSNRYYTVRKGDTLSDIAEKYYGHGTPYYYDKIANANHISNPDRIYPGERLLIPYDTGGYTGTFDGGRIALLHQKELVLNKDDTTNMLKMVNIVRDLIPKINFPDLSNLAGKLGNTIHMPITIQNLNGGKEGATEFFNIIGNHMKLMGVNN